MHIDKGVVCLKTETTRIHGVFFQNGNSVSPVSLAQNKYRVAVVRELNRKDCAFDFDVCDFEFIDVNNSKPVFICKKTSV